MNFIMVYLSRMTTLKRVRVLWTGTGTVGEGLSTFYFDSVATGFVADLSTFFNAIKAAVPNDVTWTCDSSGDTIDSDNGALNGTWTDGSPFSIVGGSTGNWAAGVGYRFRWLTGGIHLGRRVVGSTFICPIDGSLFDATGTIDNTTRTTALTAAAALLAAQTPDWKIWSRPNDVGASAVSAVTGVSLPDKVSWLRSRRT